MSEDSSNNPPSGTEQALADAIAQARLSLPFFQRQVWLILNHRILWASALRFRVHSRFWLDDIIKICATAQGRAGEEIVDLLNVNPVSTMMLHGRPFDYSQLVPKIELYKVFLSTQPGIKQSRTVLAEEKYPFPNTTRFNAPGPETLDTILSDSWQGDGAGIKSVTWKTTSRSRNPFASTIVFAEIKLFFQDVKTLFKPLPIISLSAAQREQFNLSTFSYSDLIRYAVGRPIDNRAENPGNNSRDPIISHRIKMVLGWNTSAPLLADLEETAELSREQQATLISDQLSVPLILDLHEHQLEFSENGNVELTVKYKGAVENVLSSEVADILRVGPTSADEGLRERLREARDELANAQTPEHAQAARETGEHQRRIELLLSVATDEEGAPLNEEEWDDTETWLENKSEADIKEIWEKYLNGTLGRPDEGGYAAHVQAPPGAEDINDDTFDLEVGFVQPGEGQDFGFVYGDGRAGPGTDHMIPDLPNLAGAIGSVTAAGDRAVTRRAGSYQENLERLETQAELETNMHRQRMAMQLIPNMLTDAVVYQAFLTADQLAEMQTLLNPLSGLTESELAAGIEAARNLRESGTLPATGRMTPQGRTVVARPAAELDPGPDGIHGTADDPAELEETTGTGSLADDLNIFLQRFWNGREFSYERNEENANRTLDPVDPATVDEFQSRLVSDDPLSRTPGAETPVDEDGRPLEPIYYLFLGDIIRSILYSREVANDLHGLPEGTQPLIAQQILSRLPNFKLLFGSLSLSDILANNSTQELEFNIYWLPIELNTFMNFMAVKIIGENRRSYKLIQFIQDLLKFVVDQVYGKAFHVLQRTSPVLRQFSSQAFKLDLIPMNINLPFFKPDTQPRVTINPLHDPIFIAPPPAARGPNQSIESILVSDYGNLQAVRRGQGFNVPFSIDDDIRSLGPSLLIQAQRVSRQRAYTHLVGDMFNDEKVGIYHFLLGGPRSGLLKSLKFTEVSNPLQSTALMMGAMSSEAIAARQGFGNRIRPVQSSIKVKLVGTPYFNIGQLVYVETKLVDGGYMAAEQMMMGGYYQIIEINNYIGSDRYDTEIDAALFIDDHWVSRTALMAVDIVSPFEYSVADLLTPGTFGADSPYYNEGDPGARENWETGINAILAELRSGPGTRMADILTIMYTNRLINPVGLNDEGRHLYIASDSGVINIVSELVRRNTEDEELIELMNGWGRNLRPGWKASSTWRPSEEAVAERVAAGGDDVIEIEAD